MKNKINFLWVEVIGTFLSFLIASIVIFPFYLYGIEFPFIIHNFISVFISITFMRYIFLSKYCFYTNSLLAHAIFFIIAVFSVVIFYSIYGEFKFFYEEANLNNLFGHLSFKKSVWIRNYMKKEYTFFSVFAVISSFGFLIHLIRSVWRIKNSKPKALNKK